MAITLEQQELAQRVIANKICVDKSKVIATASLRDDLGADSLDEVELVMALEDDFNVSIPDEDAEKIKTVQDVYNTLGALLQ